MQGDLSSQVQHVPHSHQWGPPPVVRQPVQQDLAQPLLSRLAQLEAVVQALAQRVDQLEDDAIASDDEDEVAPVDSSNPSNAMDLTN